MRIVIEDGLRNLMPEVALEYLREIILGDGAIRTIRLVPIKLSLGPLQEVVCEGQNGTSKRRVFGFSPVSATLYVSRGENEVVLRLAA
jgi:hypothetical protein